MCHEECKGIGLVTFLLGKGNVMCRVLLNAGFWKDMITIGDFEKKVLFLAASVSPYQGMYFTDEKKKAASVTRFVVLTSLKVCFFDYERI